VIELAIGLGLVLGAPAAAYALVAGMARVCRVRRVISESTVRYRDWLAARQSQFVYRPFAGEA
jgi:hypothetical protein